MTARMAALLDRMAYACEVGSVLDRRLKSSENPDGAFEGSFRRMAAEASDLVTEYHLTVRRRGGGS